MASAYGKVTLFLVGDSTVSNYTDKEAPRAGWGQVIGAYFGPDVTVRNAAASGRSSKSYLDEGRLDEFAKDMKQGDYLFIQFGHNDEKEDPDRHTDPKDTYPAHLRQYIDAARGAKANPVLITPVSRRDFGSDGKLKKTHGAYPAAMIKLAQEEKLPLIDLETKSGELLQNLGSEQSKALFMWLDKGESPNYPEGVQDNTHFKKYGAEQMAALVLQGIKETGLPLAKEIKPGN